MKNFRLKCMGVLIVNLQPRLQMKQKRRNRKKSKVQGISVGKALALSAILPGLGNRAVKGSGAQWLLGVAGYGCIIGSIVAQPVSL